ncbi:MAG: NUDIX hydrolase [Desulfosalsimonadaceae bacterium]
MKIQSIDKITDCRHLNMYAVSYTDRAGRQRTWYMASRCDPPKCVSCVSELPDAAVIVAFHRQHEKLVVIKEFRVPLGGYQYGFPAGLIDPGETLEYACSRELREETGLSMVRLIKSSPPIYSTSGLTDESISMVYAECEGEISNAGNEYSEDIKPFFVSRGKAAEICARPDHMVDVKTWLVLSAFAESGQLV